jgi:hypothetical protein
MARRNRGTAIDQPDQSFLVPGVQDPPLAMALGSLPIGAGNPQPSAGGTLAIRPTIYPAPPGDMVTVEDPVSINISSPEFHDSKHAIERLCAAIEQSNQVAREVGDKLVAELKAGLEYVAGPKPSRKVLDLLLVNPLYAATAIFAGTTVAGLAKIALKALLKLISPEIDIGL